MVAGDDISSLPKPRDSQFVGSGRRGMAMENEAAGRSSDAFAVGSDGYRNVIDVSWLFIIDWRNFKKTDWHPSCV
jgi:hypothetical protein